TVTRPGPFYFACGCFRDFVSRPCSALPKRRRTAPQPLLFKLDQLHPLQTRMPVLADDDGVVHGNAERCCNLDDRLGHVDIRLRWRRIAGGVVVQRSNARSIPLTTLAVLRLRVAQGSAIGSGKT